MKNTQITMLLVLAIILTLLPMMITEAVASERARTIRIMGEVREGAPRSVTIADLEAMPLTEYSAEEPYQKKRFSFTGVLLREFVKEYGAPGVEKVQLKAIDEYVVDFSRDEWMRWDIMLATRQDGKHITVKQSGPVRIVLPFDDFEEVDREVYTPRWIWLVKSIEFIKAK
jgi:hypothetical protein